MHGALERMVREGSSELKLNDEKEPVMGDLGGGGGELSRFREQQVQTRNKVGMFKEQRKKPSVAGAEWAGGGKSGRK